MNQDVTALLLDLVAIPSVSPMSNEPVIEYVAARLDPRQWATQLHSYTDSDGVRKHNLVALTKNAKNNRSELAFVCHTDTVPFDPAWQDAVHPRVTDGRVYGRGSCDVKGYLACVLAALQQIDFDALDKAIALILTADEEVGCLGAKHLAAAGAFSTRYMIIGEPTGLQPVRAGKGYSLATITVRGKEAHSAFPDVGRSAIYDAARVVSALETLAKRWQTDGLDHSFDPPFTTLNVGLIEGGTAKNIVPGECRLTVEWRPIPSRSSKKQPAEDIRAMLTTLAETTPGLDAQLTVLRNDPPFAPSASRQLADLLSTMAGQRATTISFGSEASHFHSVAEEIVVFGPGDMTVAHKTGEWVPVSELTRCVGFLVRAIKELQ